MSHSLLHRPETGGCLEASEWLRPRAAPELNGRVIEPAPVPPRLLVFCRTPGSASGKTRLAAALGPAAANRLYEAMLTDLAVEAKTASMFSTVLCFTPPDSAESLDRWLRTAGLAAEGGSEPVANISLSRPGLQLWPQPDGDLGHRMADMMEASLVDSASVVVVGSDIPGLTSDHLSGAFTALETADWVFGPCPDGGFYLVGTRRPPLDPESPSTPIACLFAGIAWSREDTLRQVLGRLTGSRVAMLELWPDLDTVEDMEPARRLIEAHRLAGGLHARLLYPLLLEYATRNAGDNADRSHLRGPGDS